MWDHPRHLCSRAERVQVILKASGFAYIPFLCGVK